MPCCCTRRIPVPSSCSSHLRTRHYTSAGFAQWKELLQLLLSCEEAPLKTRTALYVQFLRALRSQLQHSFGTVRTARKEIVLVPASKVQLDRLCDVLYESNAMSRSQNRLSNELGALRERHVHSV